MRFFAIAVEIYFIDIFRHNKKSAGAALHRQKKLSYQPLGLLKKGSRLPYQFPLAGPSSVMGPVASVEAVAA